VTRSPSLLDGFVNRLQDSQFPSFLLFKLRGFDFYPGGTFPHCSCQPFAGRTLLVTNPRDSLNARVVLASRDFAHNSALDLLEREMSRVFRVLAIGYGESKRMQVQALKQRFTLAEEDRRRCKVQGVDQSGVQILPHC
jgi:hypothetical protein